VINRCGHILAITGRERDMAFDGFAEFKAKALDSAEAAERKRQAAVLAHDFNNLLGVILVANEALVEQLPEGTDAHEFARISVEAAEKGAELLRRLIEISNPTAPRESDVDCAEALTTTARLASVSTGANVTCVAMAMPEPFVCRADRGGLDAALLNLCVNAGHALPDGGTVRLQAAAADLDADAAAALDLAPGRYVALSVSDNGVGMSPQVLARCTDAYFTTRAGRGGTGLGLSGVSAFAKNAGGALKLASQEGRGATATLYLPRA
jgi:signal transduction histidine kinase